MKGWRSARAPLIWVALALAIGVPIAKAAGSEQLAWRGPVYILAGFAGIVALGLVLVQPLLIGGYLPGRRPIADGAPITGSAARLLWRL